MPDLRAAGEYGVNVVLSRFFREIGGVFRQEAFPPLPGAGGSALSGGRLPQPCHEPFQRISGDLAQFPEKPHCAVPDRVDQQSEDKREHIHLFPPQFQTCKQVGFLQELNQQGGENRGGPAGTYFRRTSDQQRAQVFDGKLELSGDILHLARIKQFFQVVFYAYLMVAVADAHGGRAFQRVAAG